MAIFFSVMALLGGMVLVYCAAVLIAALAHPRPREDDDLDDWR